MTSLSSALVEGILPAKEKNTEILVLVSSSFSASFNMTKNNKKVTLAFASKDQNVS